MAVSVQEAIKTITELDLDLKYEIVPIENAQNRISAGQIFAKIYLPKFNNSAMDGYALDFNHKDEALKVVDTIFAGDNNDRLLEKNQCVKIMTGAKIPDNATAIVPKENCEYLDDNKIKVPNDIKEFQHIRFVGEDIKLGEILLDIGEDINFAKVTLLASQGISHVKVYKTPKIVVFASGEELKLHYEKAEDYQIYNSNTPTFITRCKELGCNVNFIGQAQDSIESIKELITNSLGADLIITSGGVSVGDADFTRDSFNELDFKTIFDGIIVKPGKPTVFGKIDNTLILNLPGNPLASALVFEVFGKLIIQKLLGSKNIYHNTIKTNISETLENKKGRITIVAGYFDGESFTPTHKKSPGMVSTLSMANSLIALDESVSIIEKNQKVNILPINWKFFTNKNKDFLTYE